MPGSPDFVLSATEFDLLCGDLGWGRPPFPLRVPSVGTTLEQRAELTTEAYASLAQRGLATGRQLDAVLEDLLRVLFQHEGSIDAVGHLDGPVQAFAAAGRRFGVLAEVVGDELWLTEIRHTALANAIVGVLPTANAGPGRAMSVPYEPLARVVNADDDDENDDPFGGDIDDQTALTRAGMPSRDAETLTELAGKRQAGGQFGVSQGSRRLSTLVTWFDTHQGRYLMVSEGAWISIAPADNNRIESRVSELLSKLD